MKKILAVLFVVCMIFAMAVPAMAETYPSVSGKEENKVTVVSSDTNKGTAEKIVLDNGDIKAVATVLVGEKFYGWTITGATYTIISGNLSTPELVIRPNGDVQLVANFTEKPTTIPGDSSTQSPQSNDKAYLGLYAAFAVIALAGAAIVVTKRYALSK